MTPQQMYYATPEEYWATDIRVKDDGSGLPEGFRWGSTRCCDSGNVRAIIRESDEAYLYVRLTPADDECMEPDRLADELHSRLDRREKK